MGIVTVYTWSVDEDDVVSEQRAAMSRPQDSHAGVRTEAVAAQGVGDRAETVATQRDRLGRRLFFFPGRNNHQLGLHLARAFHLDEAGDINILSVTNYQTIMLEDIYWHDQSSCSMQSTNLPDRIN